MSFAYEEKLSRSLLVDFVWRTEDLTDGVYVASADARWDVIFTSGPELANMKDLTRKALNLTFEDISFANSADIEVNATEPGIHIADA